MNKPSKKTPSLPSKADLLAFIRERPGKVGTREIARAFNLKNALRAELKRMLRDLADEGAIDKRRKKLHHPGTLASTLLADITARDRDGELIALLCTLYPINRFLMEFIRTDEPGVLGTPLKIGQVISLLFLVLAAGPMMVGHTGVNYALRFVPAYVANVSLLGEPIGATLIAWLLPSIHERPPAQTLVGGALILAGIALGMRRKAASPAAASPAESAMVLPE